jgi:hypothetical protein
MIGLKRIRTKSKKSQSFLSKLYDILNNHNYNNVISWDKDGKKVVISDVVKLCKDILPKFYKHRNLSSFIRQLNLYGFHKYKGIIDNLEIYEHEAFNKNITKEQIRQITKKARHNQMVKSLDTYINSNKEEEDKENELITLPEDKVLDYLTIKVEENNKNLVEALKSIEELKKQIKALNEQTAQYKDLLNSTRIVLAKLLKIHIKTKLVNNKIIKINNLYELFKKYLYYLKIYSPFVRIDTAKLIKGKGNEKEENNLNIIDNDKYESTRNNNNDFGNIKEIDDISFLNENQNNINFFDLNVLNINYSNPFINKSFYK